MGESEKNVFDRKEKNPVAHALPNQASRTCHMSHRPFHIFLDALQPANPSYPVRGKVNLSVPDGLPNQATAHANLSRVTQPATPSYPERGKDNLSVPDALLN